MKQNQRENKHKSVKHLSFLESVMVHLLFVADKTKLLTNFTQHQMMKLVSTVRTEFILQTFIRVFKWVLEWLPISYLVHYIYPCHFIWTSKFWVWNSHTFYIPTQSKKKNFLLTIPQFHRREDAHAALQHLSVMVQNDVLWVSWLQRLKHTFGFSQTGA